MRSLRAGPNGQLSIRILDGHRSVLLDREMRIPLEEKSVLKDFVGFGKPFFYIAKLQAHQLMNVPFFAIFVDSWLGSQESFLGIRDRRQDLIIDIDQVQRFKCCQLLAGDDGSDRISHMPHAVDTKGLLVLADGKNPVLDREVFPGEHEIHSRVSGGARRVDFSDARVRMGRPQQLRVRHSRQENIVGEARLAGHFRAGIDSASRDSDHAKFVSVGLPSANRRHSRILFLRHAPSSVLVRAITRESRLQISGGPQFSASRLPRLRKSASSPCTGTGFRKSLREFDLGWGAGSGPVKPSR